ncbi:hypothetical protein [Comamonas guangdongensis]|uniref:Lipoprotein n=1 Tax=Comamonas guangdongensis TaxID=510515 RepID=A0ABV3ZQ51_9BURK
MNQVLQAFISSSARWAGTGALAVLCTACVAPPEYPATYGGYGAGYNGSMSTTTVYGAQPAYPVYLQDRGDWIARERMQREREYEQQMREREHQVRERDQWQRQLERERNQQMREQQFMQDQQRREWERQQAQNRRDQQQRQRDQQRENLRPIQPQSDPDAWRPMGR